MLRYNSNEVKAQELAEEVCAMGRKAYVVKADVTDQDDVFEMRDEIAKEFVDDARAKIEKEKTERPDEKNEEGRDEDEEKEDEGNEEEAGDQCE